MFYIAVVGRPNVGKSTFFNKIAGGRPAIVDGSPGVTRDRHVAVAERGGLRFGVIDSGGLEPETREKLPALMREQTLMAIEEADMILFVVDGRKGVTPVDEEIADLLRRAGKKTIVVVNKIDDPRRADDALEFTRLGLGPVHAVSAEHSIGVEDVMEKALEGAPAEPAMEEEEERPVHVCVVGRPNVGKSSLVNRLLGRERMMVSDVPGTTRDAIDSEITVDGERVIMIDTAGIRRKARIANKLEKFSVIMAMKAIERADVALLLIDAVEGVTAQEARIAGLVEEAGKGLVIVVNKWDLVEKDENTMARYARAVRDQLRFASWAPVVFVSALTGQRTGQIWNAVREVHGQYTRRVNTARLNSMLERITAKKPPPVHRGKRTRIYYATQTSIRPPTFTFMTSAPEGIDFSYRRYIANQLREAGGFDKTPVRLIFRRPSGRRSRAAAAGRRRGT
ncbi:MAG: ribosome biogenesis GTPase Der [Candidatus Nitrospinota bacterium M3_3B_026]